jgi:toxin ParE1/3/4
MIYEIIYTEDALQDLEGIYQYISQTLLEPSIAEKQADRIMDAVDSLESMPLRFRLYEHEPWHSKGLRVLPVDNYLVFYLPDEVENIVAIIRIMYGGRDIEKQLGK